MKGTVGIPNALIHHFYPQTWINFFKALGFEVKLSSPSTKKNLTKGTDIAVIDNCLPVKLFFGHVSELLENEQIDYLFIPRFISVQKNEYLCPKFIGIPDLVKQKFNQTPVILEPVFDFNKGEGWLLATLSLARELDIPLQKSLRALIAAKKAYKHETETFKKRLNNLTQHRNAAHAPQPVIALVGHDYVIRDPLLGQPIRNKLTDLECFVVTTDRLRNIPKHPYGHKFIHKPLYWTKNQVMLDATFHLVEQNLVDGVIQLNSFPCGPDSVVSSLIDRRIEQMSRVPTMTITLDEHTGLAGVYTRIEAFLDLIKRRDQYENNLSSHG